MGTYRNRFGPHNPDETYVAHDVPEQLVDLGEVEMNYAIVGDRRRSRRCCSSPVRPSRGGATSRRCRCSPSTSRSSPSTSAARVGPPGPPVATRSTTWATTSCASSTSSSAGRRSSAASRRAACCRRGCPPTPSPDRSSPRTTRTRRSSRRRSTRRPARASARASARCSASGAPTSATSGASATGMACAAAAPDVLPAWLAGASNCRGAAAEPQGVRPRVGPRLHHRQRRRVVRSRPDAAIRRRAGAVHPPLPARRPRHRSAHGSRVRPAGGAGRGRCSPRPGSAVDYRSFETMGHSMHGQDPQLFADTLVDWVAGLLARLVAIRPWDSSEERDQSTLGT